MRFVGVPPLPAQIGYALEGVVVFSSDVVHVVALDGSPSDVCSVELVVDGELHPMAVVRKGVAGSMVSTKAPASGAMTGTPQSCASTLTPQKGSRYMLGASRQARLLRKSPLA